MSPKKYAVLLESDFGSRSPAMHNAAFRRAAYLIRIVCLELPDENGLADVNSATSQRFGTTWRHFHLVVSPVTIPHKLRVQPFLDELTDAARKIGAVNTITPRPAVVTSRTTSGRRLRARADLCGNQIYGLERRG